MTARGLPPRSAAARSARRRCYLLRPCRRAGTAMSSSNSRRLRARAHSYARPWATADQQPQSAPAHVTSFPALRLRPVSTLFSAHFGEHIVSLDDDDGGGELRRARRQATRTQTLWSPALDTPRSSSPGVRTSPLVRGSSEHSGIVDGGALGAALHAQQILDTKSTEQRQIRELEGRVRDLQANSTRCAAVTVMLSACTVAAGRGLHPRPCWATAASSTVPVRAPGHLRASAVRCRRVHPLCITVIFPLRARPSPLASCLYL